MPIADVTTRSMEAYRYYLEGKENLRKFYFNDARIALEKAVKLDPDFAMAYFNLARANLYLENIEARDTAIKRAKALSLKTTEKERLYIEEYYAWRGRSDAEKINRASSCRWPKNILRKKRYFIVWGFITECRSL